jgi:hypothetical protein
MPSYRAKFGHGPRQTVTAAEIRFSRGMYKKTKEPEFTDKLLEGKQKKVVFTCFKN